MAISTGSTITASDINNALAGKADSTHTHSGGDITSAVANATNATNADTLDGYHASSFLQASSYTASDVLTKIKTVDGAGSGLDADTLDGFHVTSSGWGGIPIIRSDGVMEVGKHIDFHLTSNSTADYEPRLHALDPNNLAINSNKIWHAGNDGSGSGLDADFVRGLPADFTSSLTTSGYQKLPSGLIIQWGRVGSGRRGRAGQGGYVTFPIAFPNAVFSVNAIVSEEIDNDGATSVRITPPAISRTGFSYYCYVGEIITYADYIYWIAIGR